MTLTPGLYCPDHYSFGFHYSAQIGDLLSEKEASTFSWLTPRFIRFREIKYTLLI